MKTALLLAPLSLVLLAGCKAQTIDVSDGFEQPTLGPLWATDRFAPGAVVMESKVVHSGRQAVAVTVRSLDVFEAGQHGDLDSERDELREADRLTAKEGIAYETSFSMFFPADFPIVPTRLVIAQWKQYCPSKTPACDDQSPVLAMRYINGELLITQDLDRKPIVLFHQRGEFRNRWLNFRFRERFTPNANGHIAVWLDGKQVVDYKGITADPEGGATGYPATGHFYFKMGLYRDVMKEPMTVYIDDYSKMELKPGEF